MRRDIHTRLTVFLYHRKYSRYKQVCGIPEHLTDNPGVMQKIAYRTMRYLKRKYPEMHWIITGKGATSWITDKPKKGGEK